jgi:hypothetical protein
MSKMCRSNPMLAALACLRRHQQALALSLVVACLTPLLSATPASAVIAHPFLSSFNGEETPTGRLELSALAVDYSASQSAGDIYVATGANAVDKFSPPPGSSYLCQITGAGSATSSKSECDSFGSGPPSGPFNGAVGVAVDPASGDVYIADTTHHVVDKFDATGAYLSQITGFSRPGSLAVDASTGDLYILDENEVKKYAPTSASLTTFAIGTPAGSFERAFSLAVDNSTSASAGDVYVDELANGVVDKFDSSGTFLVQLSGPASGPFGSLTGLVVDPANGDLYVADSGGGTVGTVDQFDTAGGFLGQIVHGPMLPVSVALAANGDVYVADANQSIVDVFGPGVVVPGVQTGSAGDVAATSASVEGTVNPAGLTVSDCHFDYVDEAHYNPTLANPYGAGQTAPCVPGAPSLPSDSEDHAVSASISGLTPSTTYHFRLQASNANGTNEGRDATVTTLPTPVVDSASASELTASSMVFTAKINPRGSDTHYRFEYGTSTAYGESVPVPAEDIGSGEEDVTKSQTVGSLVPNRTYHWRVVAVNANGTTFGADHTFIHDTSAEQGLPDNRAYELVSPPHRNGAALGFELGAALSTEISSSGSRVMTSSLQCFGASESCNAQNSDSIGTPYEFDRTGSGWVTTSLTPPASRFSRAIPWGVSIESGMLLFGAPTEPFGEEDLYTRQAGGTFAHLGPATRPEAGPQSPQSGGAAGSPQAFTADLSHVAWQTFSGADRATLWPYDQTNTGHVSVYEYAGNEEPLLVGVTGGEASHDLVSVCGTLLGGGEVGQKGVMSTDGRIVFFTATGEPGCTGWGMNRETPVPANALYARVDGERSDAHTVAISARSVGDCTGECLSSRAGDANFAGASADGSKAFFLSTQRLTDQASQDNNRTDNSEKNDCAQTQGENGCNLYLYDFGDPAGKGLVTVSAGDSSGEGPRVRGVMAISDDGSHVYFVAQGVLAANRNSAGQSAQDGANNLYVFERDAANPDGRVTFIASLPQTDEDQWGIVPQSNVTPDGRYLVFVSHGELTVDDSSASGAYQVFRYDAQTGDLIRISVGNDGFNDNGNRSTPTPCEPFLCSEDARLAWASSQESRRDLTMSDDGSYVFFDSPVALTPHALDDLQLYTEVVPRYAQNVYEWHAGHVYLISDGKDATRGARQQHCAISSAVCLLGTDATGSNVFFSTADQLISSDINTEVDYYDARVCAPEKGDPCIQAPPAGLPPCLGEVCHGTPAGVPGVPSAPTVTFSGQGNVFAAPVPVSLTPKSLTRAQKRARALRACHKKRNARMRIACERSARKRYGPRGRAKRSSVASRARRNGRSK